MATPKVELSPLTPEAAHAVLKSTPPFRMIGHEVRLDGELVGILGEYIVPGGARFLFSDQIRPDVLPKKFRVRLIRDIMDRVTRRGVPVYAVCCTPRDQGFLERYGFRHVRDVEVGALMLWSP